MLAIYRDPRFSVKMYRNKGREPAILTAIFINRSFLGSKDAIDERLQCLLRDRRLCIIA